MKKCIKCTQLSADDVSFCPRCGSQAFQPIIEESTGSEASSGPLYAQQNTLPHTIVITQPPQPASRSNGFGTAGFVLALIGLVFCWMPVVGWIVWILGFIFSCIGLARKPKGMAIAGFVLSLVSILIIFFVTAFWAGRFSQM